MDVIQQIEAMRKRILQEINTEFDIFIENVSKKEDIKEVKNTIEPYEIVLPLTAGTGIFKGKKVTKLNIGNETFAVKTWKELVLKIMEKCLQSEQNEKLLCEQLGNISGKKRIFLAETSEGMRSPLKLKENMYMETHYDTETLLRILITRILIPIGFDISNITVSVRNEW